MNEASQNDRVDALASLSDLVLGSLGIVRNVPQKGRLTEEAERDSQSRPSPK
jgi:hypothetical protein